MLFLQSLDLKLWSELKEAFIEWRKALLGLIPFLHSETKENTNTLLIALFLCPGVFLLSFPGLLTGYFVRIPKLIVAIQILALGVLYQFLVWIFFAIPARPLSFGILLCVSILIGIFLKQRANERDQMEAASTEVLIRNKELQESRLTMVKQDEEDRRLLAADLHDQILNDLRNIVVAFEQYTRTPDDSLKNQIVQQLKSSMTDIREIMDDLCPVILAEFGLCAAIEERLDKAAKHSKLKVRFNTKVDDKDLERFSIVEQQLIYRLVQESITNLCKHANASQVNVSISKQGEHFIFRTTDNGVGFDPIKMSNDSRGTMYMRLRASLIDATVSWQTPENGIGTDFILSVPSPSESK
ncbi:hypothetical protein KA183_11040 [bacterium]|nr:hypothetical protein [bacterium]